MAISISTLNLNDHSIVDGLHSLKNQLTAAAVPSKDAKVLSSEECIKLEQTYGAHK